MELSEEDKKKMKEANDKFNDDFAVDQFARAMKEKLAECRKNNAGGWQACAESDLEDALSEEIGKDVVDPVDIANYACFLWNNRIARGESGSPAKIVEKPSDYEAYTGCSLDNASLDNAKKGGGAGSAGTSSGKIS